MKTTFLVSHPYGTRRTIRPTGRNRWALLELIRAGRNGCTPITHPGPRWSAYIHNLRHDFGLNIETVHETHHGPFPGHHARYVLKSNVYVVADESEAA